MDATCGDVVRLMQETRHGGFPVTNAGRLVGIITLDDPRRIPSPAERLRTPVRQATTAQVQVAYPDESLEHALETLAHFHVGRLPVVGPADRSRVLGIITRSDILDACNRAIVSPDHAAGNTRGSAHGDTVAHSRSAVRRRRGRREARPACRNPRPRGGRR